ncbi:MAG TPA: metalloregulator ArsR/SmtB family transcription factor [Stellaceae bacterium]|nr:metalloregulator ArsR/SmtB family transcription factor [Stellaceae bacterium]
MNIQDLERNATDAAQFLKALGNEKRLQILCRLHEGELSVGELQQAVRLGQSALSQHLARLRKDRLVRTRRESQTIYYSLADDAVTDVIAVLHGRFCAPAQTRRRVRE